MSLTSPERNAYLRALQDVVSYSGRSPDDWMKLFLPFGWQLCRLLYRRELKRVPTPPSPSEEDQEATEVLDLVRKWADAVKTIEIARSSEPQLRRAHGQDWLMPLPPSEERQAAEAVGIVEYCRKKLHDRLDSLLVGDPNKLAAAKQAWDRVGRLAVEPLRGRVDAAAESDRTAPPTGQPAGAEHGSPPPVLNEQPRQDEPTPDPAPQADQATGQPPQAAPQQESLERDSNVDLEQIAAIVHLKARSMDRYKRRQEDPLPDPDYPGSGGQRDHWRWSTVRPWLRRNFSLPIPEHFPDIYRR